MRLFLIAASCATALASSVYAQEPPPATTLEQRQAQATEMISAASAGEFFVHEDHGPAVTVRHGRSGLLCRFIYGAPGQEVIMVPSVSLGIAHGDDVACSSRNELGVITMYATRRSDVASSDEALAGAVGALRRAQPSARPVNVPPPGADEVPLPDGSRTATFMFTMDGREHFTRVSVYVRDGWVYKMRFSSPFQEANSLADASWTAALNDLPAPAGGTP